MSATPALDAPAGVLSSVRDIESDRRKLVYLYLAVQGGATLEELKADLELPLLTLLCVLPDLRENDLVAETEDGRWVARESGQFTSDSGPKSSTGSTE